MKHLCLIALACLTWTGIFALWSVDPQNPNLIAGLPAEQVMPKVAIGDNGNTYICRFDNYGGGYKVYLNLFSREGNPLWTDPNGVLVSDHLQMSWLTEYDLDVDTSGNAVVVFQDIRNAGTNNVVAYKISPSGTLIWGPDGIALSSDTNPDIPNMSPVVCCSNDESTYVAWQRMGTANSTVVQRLSFSGQKLWGDNGLAVSSLNARITWPQIIQADGANILLKYYLDTGPVYAPTRHLYVAKYTPDGQQLWNTLMTDAGGISAWHQLIPFESDGAGGAILAWYEDRDSNQDNDVYVQRVTTGGTITMPEDGALVSVDPANQQYDPELAVDTANQNVYAFYRITDAGQNSWGLARQKLDYAGNRLWGETGVNCVDLGGIEVYTVGAYYSYQGAICLYESGDDLYANCWRSNGNLPWPVNPVALATTVGQKYHFDLAVHPDEWSVLGWEQGFNEMDIYAMRLNCNGSLGMEYPAPRGFDAVLAPPDDVQITWMHPSQYFLPDFYNVYMNNDLLQTLPATQTSYLVSNLAPGEYTFYMKARYGDNYSPQTHSILINVVSNDDATASIPPIVARLHPNPFRDSASLVYTLPKAVSTGRVSVYNLKGQQLAEKEIQAGMGTHIVPMDELLPSLSGTGIYFIRLELDGEVHVLKALRMN